MRCDDRRVQWNGKSVLISEIERLFRSEKFSLSRAAKPLSRQNVSMQEVAETEIVLNRPHSKVIDGKKCKVPGKPIKVRWSSRVLLDEDDYVLAQWTLLCNVFDTSISGHQIALWYYWRWLIETYFKLSKEPRSGIGAVATANRRSDCTRILVASMACVAVLAMQNDESDEASETKRILIRLSGRQMKYGVESTPPALLAGFMVLLSVTDILESTDIDIGTLKRIAKDALPFGLV